MTEDNFIKNHVFIVAPKKLYPKRVLKATNNFKDLTAVYVLSSDEKNKDLYLRKYLSGFSNNKIYSETLSLINPRCIETPLKDLSDIETLKQYDNNTFGGFFE